MNRYGFIAVLSFVLALLWAGCNDDNNDDIKDPGASGNQQAELRLLNNQAIDRLGGTFYWAVKANEKWKLDEDELPEWLSFDPLSGKAGTTSVRVKADTLYTNEAREAVLAFMMETDTLDVTIQQNLDGELAEGLVCRFKDDAMFGIEGDPLTKILEASESWTVTTHTPWLTVSPASGEAGETELSLTATESDGHIRVAVLNFALGDTILELAVTQGLNQNKPILTLPGEAVIVGNQATVTSHCKFINDKLEIEEVGFAFRPKAVADAWEYVAAELTATAGEFDFNATATLKWGTEYVYKPYGKLNGVTAYGEEKEFTTNNRTIEGGVWYYENFDGMYDPETKAYAQAAIDNGYNYWGKTDQFEKDGGFLRQTQPTATYTISSNRIYCDCNPAFPSARIHPQDKPWGWPAPTNVEEGTQFYEGASGNWFIFSRYDANWSCEISGLDFAGAPALQLTFGCFCYNGNNTNSEVPADANLKVLVSDNGKDWTELTLSYKPIYDQREKRWKHVVIDDFPNTTVAIRIQLNNSGQVYAIDDIKVTEK